VPEIEDYSKKLDNECRNIKKQVLKLCLYMRGLSYAEGMNMSYEERELVSEIIKENLETTKKTGLSFF